ncbi:PR-1-like protein [Mycena maculata]|uniref:PR-1-like protein n=1 Tax=Mycena maculata TaxID=230809 RepID=A0AAD7IY50_9AGAR|nr:PR-1-like protein [Mycena maculata]
MFLVAILLASASLAMALATPDTPRFLASRRHAGAARSLSSILATDAYLYAHNIVRAAHGAQDLVWNMTLATQAQTWANTCQVQHSDGSLLDNPYGENIIAATGQFPISDAIHQFTLDESEYDPAAANPTYTHFTQVVWKSTTQLGCAVAHCEGIFDPSLGMASYYVCLYDPPGNVIGDAPANVQV